MLTVMLFWLESLKFFIPTSFFPAIVGTIRKFVQVVITLITTLRWFFIVDLLIFIFFGQKIIDMISTVQNATYMPHAHAMTLLFSLGSEVIWLIVSAASLLFVMRQNEELTPLAYFKAYFFKFIQLSLFFSLLIFLVLVLLMGFGITKIPKLHWFFTSSFRFVQLSTFFYWFDSSFSFKDILKSCEKSINFVVYNLPLFGFIFMAIWICESFLKGILWGWQDAFVIDQTFFGGKTNVLLQEMGKNLSVIRFVFFKYSNFFINFFWICFIFMVYEAKKQISYAKSFFE